MVNKMRESKEKSELPKTNLQQLKTIDEKPTTTGSNLGGPTIFYVFY